MTPPDAPADRSGQGHLSPTEGTPAAVDLTRDLRARWIWAMFVAGPTVWFAHFMLVYLVAEAGCTGGGPGLEVFDPPVPVMVTLVATAVAVLVCAAAAVWSLRHWRANRRAVRGADHRGSEAELDDDRRRGALAWAGFLLSSFSVLAILFTGAPALVLGPC